VPPAAATAAEVMTAAIVVSAVKIQQKFAT